MKIRNLYISPDHNYFGHYGKPPGDAPMIEIEEAEVVEGSGIKGDRFFDYKPDYKGQVTFFSQEVFEEMCERFAVFDKEPAAFRRNIIVEGADLNSLIDEAFEVQGVRFFGTQESAPCFWMEQAFCPGAEEALKGRGGLRAMVMSSGRLRRD